MENENQDSYIKFVKKWPLPRFIRPKIAELVKMYVPQINQPLPLNPNIIKDSEENNKQLEILSHKIKETDKEYNTLCKELEDIEKESQWNNRSKRELRVKQLTQVINEIKDKKVKIMNNYNNIFTSGEYNNYLITTHKVAVESYEKIKNMEKQLKIESAIDTSR